MIPMLALAFVTQYSYDVAAAAGRAMHSSPSQADSRAILRPLDDVNDVTNAVRAVCESRAAKGDSSPRFEDQASRQLTRRPKSDHWNELAINMACVRATELARRRVATDGYLMPIGTSLADGAFALSDSVLVDDPSNVPAARLVAILGLVVAKVDSNAVVPKRSARTRGEPPGQIANLLYRAVRAGVDDSTVFRGCVSLALAAADYPTARDCGRRALAAGADSSWHLLRLAYLAFHTADTLAGTQLFRESIAVAGDRTSRAEVGWHFNFRVRTSSSEQVSRSSIPLTIVPPLADSIALLWLGLSDSVQRVAWADSLLGEQQRVGRKPLGELLRTHFYSVTYAWGAFWGCEQPGYLLTASAPTGEVLYQRGPLERPTPCFPTLPPDLHPIKVTAARYRLWSGSSAPVTVVAYALGLSSMAPSEDDSGSAIHYTLDFRERDAAANHWSDSAASSRRVIGGVRQGFLQGIIALPRADAASDWTFSVNQDITRRGIVDEGPPPLGRGPLELSDVVVGDPAQHLTWMLGQDSIVLAPLGAVDRHSTLELFVQLRSARAEPRLRTTVRVFRVRDGVADRKAVIQIASTGSARAGITSIHRELDVNRLGTGIFQLQVQVTSATDQVMRATRLEVH